MMIDQHFSSCPKQLGKVNADVSSTAAEDVKPSKRKKRRRESTSGTNEAVVDSIGDPDDDMVSSLSRVASVRENQPVNIGTTQFV
jgi:hypothetical protein